jgi:hypothetical protein
MREFLKDPDAVLDYVFDWSSWLATSETITTSVITVETGLTKASESSTTTTAKVWLSGGTEGERYKITSRITTNQGRTDDRSAIVRVANR